MSKKHTLNLKSKYQTYHQLNMGNQYSEQYYIDKICELETEIEDTNANLKHHCKLINNLNSKIDVLTTATSSIIQKNKQAEELIESLSQFKDFFENNSHIFHPEEYDEDYNTDDQSNSEDEENEEESKTRNQLKRKCKVNLPQRIQPKRQVKNAAQPKSIYR
jgi:hypothetical protein